MLDLSRSYREDSDPVGTPRRLFDSFSNARTPGHFSHFGTHLPPRIFLSFQSLPGAHFATPLLSNSSRNGGRVHPHPHSLTFRYAVYIPNGFTGPSDVSTFRRSDILFQVLLLSKLQAPINRAESTLSKVFILKPLKVPLESITFEKPGRGSPLWLTNCSKKVSPRSRRSGAIGGTHRLGAIRGIDADVLRGEVARPIPGGGRTVVQMHDDGHVIR